MFASFFIKIKIQYCQFRTGIEPLQLCCQSRDFLIRPVWLTDTGTEWRPIYFLYRHNIAWEQPANTETDIEYIENVSGPLPGHST